MFSILIVEDDNYACKEFTEYISNYEDVCIIGCTATASEAISLCQLHKPNAMILDLELHYGSGTGLDVLEALNTSPNIPKPYILITTNNSSQIVHERARQLGADFILYKHQKDYSSEYAANLLLSMKDIIKNMPKNTLDSSVNSIPSICKKQQLRNQILNILQVLGFNPKYKGYSYLLDAIEMANNGTYHFIVEVAKKYSVTTTSVERAMQGAINKTWNSTDIDILLKHYTSKVDTLRGTPTVVEFVRYYSHID